MTQITNIELQSSIEYFAAVFIDIDGKTYDMVFTRNIEKNIGWEDIELVNVQLQGKDVDDEILWKEIKENLSGISINER